ncbi:TIGR02466 family protein [Streptomyces sp. NBC_01304]|uniref:TIGR02466 family protein n=1 Tax=Streptomyces sp. NBC_01304 TaxID=2903818 RepID=UPI002E14CF9D|nr:2OG-Fe(II) oxygenase family protein [Streptomyces sp. NBC_01304]
MTTSDVLDHAALWETPLYTQNINPDPQVNAALRDLVMDRTRTAPNSAVGVLNADKTSSDLLRWDHPAISQLRGWILDAADALNAHAGTGQDSDGQAAAMVAEAWAVVYRPEGLHMLHSHHDAAWSGVFYVSTGRMEKDTGLLQFVDPRPAAAARELDRSPLHTVTPVPGLLVAFPAWLRHWVTPYQGDTERIVIAFNVGFRDPA